MSAQTRFAFGHDGIPETLDINAFFQKRLAHIHGNGSFAKHDGHDGMFAGKDFIAEFLDMFSEIRRILTEAFNEAWILLQNRERFNRGNRD